MSNRIIKDSLWTSKKLARCSQKAQLHYPRIYLRVDDWSCCEIDIEDIVQTCYKKWHPKPQPKTIVAILKEFEGNGLLFVWKERGNAYGYFTGDEEGRLPAPTRKHKRHTPEPPQEELAAYLQNYNCLQSDYEALQSDYLSPSPSPSLNHSPNPCITSGKPDTSYIIETIISFLNEQADRHFSPKTKSTQDLIKARLKEGRTLNEFKRVIKVKSKQWKDDSAMCGYLRPETLFAAKHFESYLNEPETTNKNSLAIIARECSARKGKFPCVVEKMHVYENEECEFCDRAKKSNARRKADVS